MLSRIKHMLTNNDMIKINFLTIVIKIQAFERAC